MVQNLDKRVDSPMNIKTSAFVKCSSPDAKVPARLFKSDEHEETPPVAFASSLSRKPGFIEQEEAAIMTRHGPGIRYRGTEYITNITTPSTAVGRGQILYAMPISPQAIASTRLQLACQMFTRYIFRSIKFIYAGTAPTTTSGSMMMFGDYDPAQNPGQSPGDGALRYSFTHNAAEFSVWQSAVCEVNDKVYEDMLYCDPDAEPRWNTQGCFWLMSSGALAAALECGKIIIEYEIDFAVPDFRGTIPVTPISSMAVTIAATPAGSVVVFGGYSGPRGAFMLRVDSTPSQTVTFNVSNNAYLQGAQTIVLQPGQIFFCTTSAAGSQLIPLWTPDLYSLYAQQQDAIVMAIVTSTNTTFNATLFPLNAVTND